ncbi:CPBP family intramembrane metalloprotease [Candidatus Dojkabacteria bacterium]|uniref:CPBP family intramembrane metalloprotease n=1 Tax=Candidatus Dojkabacteria bacterium TaxID=2099670 RepID=A0A955RJ37_9BACT|nr:CPBP family intramembrane metalloprotease [Candidatus Dojkabacteria bacterium]
MNQNKQVLSILLILLGLITLSGIGYSYIPESNQLVRIVYIATLYMPTPFYSLVIYSALTKENIFKKYILKHNISLKGISFTISMVFLWGSILFFLTYLLGKLSPETFSELVTNNEQLLANIEKIAGSEAANNTDLPPTPLILIPIAFISSITAGFTINLFFALGEEIFWRGYLWDKYKELTDWKVSILIGSLWGLWHIPLIIQGYNYGTEHALSGSIMFIFFCISFSYPITLLMRQTSSTVLAAGMHGMFNAFAGIFIILVVSGNPLIDGSIGLLSIVTFMITGLIAKHALKRSTYFNS